MKVILGTVTIASLVASLGIAGNVDNVTSQSAQYLRAPARQASTDLDGAYYNPSGLVKLRNGLYCEFSNLTILRKDTIATLKSTYESDNPILLFPTASIVLKSGRIASYLSFHLPGGGGRVHYEAHPIASGSETQVVAMAAQESGLIDGASILTSEVIAESLYLGVAFGIAYEFEELFSISFGIRGIAAQKRTRANINYSLTSSVLNRQITTRKLRLDAKQNATGSGIIVGISIYPIENMIFSLKYETSTPLEFINKTTRDDLNYFTQDERIRRDMPGLATLGTSIKLSKNLTIDAGYTRYFTSSANWDKALDGTPLAKKFDDGWDSSASLLYNITPTLGLSIGTLRTINAHNKATRTSIDFGLNSWMIGGGLIYKANKDLTFNLGLAESLYEKKKNQDKSLTFGQRKASFALGVAAKL